MPFFLYSLYAQNQKHRFDSYIFELFQLTGIQVSSEFIIYNTPMELVNLIIDVPKRKVLPGESRTTTSVPTIHWCHAGSQQASFRRREIAQREGYLPYGDTMCAAT